MARFRRSPARGELPLETRARELAKDWQEEAEELRPDPGTRRRTRLDAIDRARMSALIDCARQLLGQLSPPEDPAS